MKLKKMDQRALRIMNKIIDAHCQEEPDNMPVECWDHRKLVGQFKYECEQKIGELRGFWIGMVILAILSLFIMYAK